MAKALSDIGHFLAYDLKLLLNYVYVFRAGKPTVFGTQILVYRCIPTTNYASESGDSGS